MNSSGAPRTFRSAPILKIVHGLIRAYQLSFSMFLGRQCRYLPTCSEYLDEAITKHGLYAGGFLGFFRLCRCHPWGGSGFDPVPDSLPEGAHRLMPWTYLVKVHQRKGTDAGTPE